MNRQRLKQELNLDIPDYELDKKLKAVKPELEMRRYQRTWRKMVSPSLYCLGDWE